MSKYSPIPRLRFKMLRILILLFLTSYSQPLPTKRLLIRSPQTVDDENNDDATAPPMIDNDDEQQTTDAPIIRDITRNVFNLKINMKNIDDILDEYLDTVTITSLFNIANPNPTEDDETLVAGLLIRDSGDLQSKTQAETYCETFNSKLIEITTEDLVAHIIDHVKKNVWVELHRLSKSSQTYYTFPSGQPLVPQYKNDPIAVTLPEGINCVLFDFANKKFTSVDCTTGTATVLCQPNMAAYETYTSLLPVQNALIEDIRHIKEWYDSSNANEILHTQSFPATDDCADSLEVISHTYASLQGLDFNTLYYRLNRFLTKFEFMMKFINFLKIIENANVLTTLGFEARRLPDESICMSWDVPTFSLTEMPSFYSFSITDLCLAASTLLVAFFSCIHTYIRCFRTKRYKSASSISNKDSKQSSYHSGDTVSALSAPVSSISGRSRENIPLFRQVRRVSFSSEISQARDFETDENSEEDESPRSFHLRDLYV